MPHSPSLVRPTHQPYWTQIGGRSSHDVQPPFDLNTMADSVARAAAQAAQAARAAAALAALLCTFALSAAADNTSHVPDHVTAIARNLDTLAAKLQPQNATSVLSDSAVQNASDLIARCDFVFAQTRQLVEKKTQEREGEAHPTAPAERIWPMTEQSTELLRLRLESLKDGLALMLQVLHFASIEAEGQPAERDFDEEREKVRQLHLRQEKSTEALKALESKLDRIDASDDEMSRGSNVPSRVPTIDFIVNTQGPARTPPAMRSTSRRVNPTATIVDHCFDHSQASDSEDSATDDDDEEEEEGEERLTVEELAHCTAQIQDLLKGIGDLQRSYNAHPGEKSGSYSKFKVQKLYKRFRRRFESAMEDRKPSAATSAVPFPGFQPPPNSHNDSASHRPPIAAPPFESGTSYSYENYSRNLAPIQEPRRTQSVGTQSHYADKLSAATIHHELHSNGRDERVPDHRFHTASNANHSVSAMNISHVQNDVPSRESSKEGSQSGADRDMESTSGRSAPVHYTKTGRISKAKKGLKVHTCSECGKSFTRAEHLRRHQKNHGPDQVTCDLCGKVFFRVDLLMRHVERHKDGPMPPSTTHSLGSSQDAFEGHRPVIYPFVPGQANLDGGPPRSREGPGAESTQSQHYVWNERDRRHVYVGEGAPSVGDQRNLMHDPRTQRRPSNIGVSFNPPSVRSTANDEKFHQNASAPIDYESAYHPNKRRRTEGDIHRASQSPMPSPPSPWVKEHRTLPPLPSPLQASYTRSPYSAASDGVKGLRSMSPPPPGRTWTHVNSPQTAEPADGHRPSIAQRYEDQRPPTNIQPFTFNDSASRRPEVSSSSASKLTPPNPRSLQGPSHESAAPPSSSFPTSQPTSPATNSTPRIYPNPIRPHEPRHGMHISHVEKPASTRSTIYTHTEVLADAPDSASQTRARVVKPMRQRSKGAARTPRGSDESSPERGQEDGDKRRSMYETDEANVVRMRKVGEQTRDGPHHHIHQQQQQNPPSSEQNTGHAVASQRDSSSGKDNATPLPPPHPSSNNSNSHDAKKDIVDKLLEHWTVPSSSVAS